MMKPFKISFYAYAENEQEAQELEAALYEAVAGQYQHGTLVTAQALAKAVRRYGGSTFLQQLMK